MDRRLALPASCRDGNRLGRTLTRKSLFDAITSIRDFDADGIIGKTDVGNRNPSPCVIMTQVQDGKLVRVHPKKPGTLDCDKKNLSVIKLDLT